MSNRVVFLLAFLFFTNNILGQQRFSVSGVVVDSKSKAIASATISLLNANKGAVCNDEGKFALNEVFEGTYTIAISAIGYASSLQQIIIDKNTTADLKFVLKEEAIQLDEVIVSAEKKEDNLQKAPLSITALTSKRINQLRLWNTRDLSSLVPNLYSGHPGDGRNVTAIRGITSTSYDQAIATYVDGVSQFTLDSYIPQLYDVERIEVLRGPQGTLYGRNAMGGVINIITKQPSNRTEGFAELSIGNFGLQRYAAGIRTPIVKDKLFIGANALYEGNNGYFTNEFNDSKFDKQHSLGTNVYLRYLMHPKWMMTLNLKQFANRNNGPFPLAGTLADALDNPFKLNQNALSKLIDNTSNSSLVVSYNGANINFSSQTAYQSNYRYYDKPIDGDFSPIDGVTVINNYGSKWNKVKVLTQELKLSSPAASKAAFKWTAGLFFFYQDAPTKQATHFGKDAQLVGSPDINFSIINSTHLYTTGVALFSQGTYSISEKADITGGLRFDYQSSRETVLGEYESDASPGQLFPIRPDTSGKTSYQAVSPTIRFSFRPSNYSTLFASFSKGFRAGGLTQLAADPSVPPLYAFKPEFSNNFEIGLKNTLYSGKLRFNVSLFYTTVQNAQVPTLVLPDAITVTKNTGKLNSKGFDVEIASKLIRNLEASYNFGYTHATYSVLKLSQYGQELDLAGKRQIFTPAYTSMLSLQYAIPLSDDGGKKLFFGGEWMSYGEVYFDLGNNIKQSPYSLFTARVGFSIHKFDLTLWGRNLSDKRYISYAYDFGAVHLGNPRVIGATARIRF